MVPPLGDLRPPTATAPPSYGRSDTPEVPTVNAAPDNPNEDVDADVGDAVSVRLRDGTAVDLVAMRPADAERLVRFHHTLSPDTTYRRFFAFHPELNPKELSRFTHVDHREREAIIAVVDGEIIGVARYDHLDGEGGADGDAEVAFVVADSWQGQGLGTILLEHLAERARQAGLTRLVADTLAHNRPMLAVFDRAGATTEGVEAGIVHITIDLGAPTSP